MTSRDCVKISLYANEIDSSIASKIMNAPRDQLVHLTYLENGINPGIGALKR